MIGVALHLLALVPAAVSARATRFGLGLLCRAPQGSEIKQLAAECDVLRGERDFARAQLADAQTLAHEARLEFGAAREACEQLRGELATARQERDALHEAAANAVAAGQLYEEGTVSLADAKAAGLALAKLCLSTTEAPRG